MDAARRDRDLGGISFGVGVLDIDAARRDR